MRVRTAAREVWSRWRSRARSESGFSLTEVLVVVSIGAVVATATISIVFSTIRAEGRTADVSETLNETRQTFDRARREIREARRLFPDDNGECDPRQLHFWVDRNQDAILSPDEEVFYAVVTDGGETRLERWTGDDPSQRQLIARHLVDADVFTCDLDPPDTRVVEIVIQVEGPRGLHTVTLDGTVRLRNVD